MPILDDERLESFAWLIASDFTPYDAALACEYKAREGTATERAGRPEVVARVAEIRACRESGPAALQATIDRLMAYADKLGANDDAASINQARLCLNDAVRLRAELPSKTPSPPSRAGFALNERRRQRRRFDWP